MSAFQSYAGVYDFGGRRFRWRCYATARLHGLRRFDHAPFPSAPAGKKWLRPWRRNPLDPEIALLVDEQVRETAHMLLQIAPAPEPEHAEA